MPNAPHHSNISAYVKELMEAKLELAQIVGNLEKVDFFLSVFVIQREKVR